MNEIIKKYIPKKYWERVESIEKEDGLIDGCKYMVYFKDGWHPFGDETSVPCRSIEEVKVIVEEATKSMEIMTDEEIDNRIEWLVKAIETLKLYRFSKNRTYSETTVIIEIAEKKEELEKLLKIKGERK